METNHSTNEIRWNNPTLLASNATTYEFSPTIGSVLKDELTTLRHLLDAERNYYNILQKKLDRMEAQTIPHRTHELDTLRVLLMESRTEKERLKFLIYKNTKAA